MRLKILFSAILILTVTWANAQWFRYTQKVSTTIKIDTGVVYATADQVNYPYNDETNTTPVDLKFDIYYPTPDSVLRPLIIMVHGGGFIEGTRKHDDMLAMCDTFSRMGYVAATIDYRQGMYTTDQNFTPISGTRAVYRGLQDIRSAIRYFRANYATYSIDTNKIYIIGSSAGAFMALHNAFMTKPEEKPTYAGSVTYTNPIYPYNSITAPDLGGFDIGANLNHTAIANLIIPLWGAVGDTAYIDPDELIPIYLMHGTGDTIVPFGYGSPFQSPYMPPTYGSKLIDSQLIRLGYIDKKTYFPLNQPHEFYGALNGSFSCDTCPNAYWDTVINEITLFLWEHHKPTAQFTCTQSATDNFTFTCQATTSQEIERYIWLIDVNQDTIIETTGSITYTFQTAGTHKITLYVENKINSWDTTSQYVSIQIATKIPQTPKFQIYPNPAQNYITIQPPDNQPYTVKLISQNGKTILHQTFINSKSIPLNNIPNGIYIIQIIQNNKTILTDKIIVNK